MGRYVVEVEFTDRVSTFTTTVEVLADAITGDDDARLVAAQMVTAIRHDHDVMPTATRIVRLTL